MTDQEIQIAVQELMEELSQMRGCLSQIKEEVRLLHEATHETIVAAEAISSLLGGVHNDMDGSMDMGDNGVHHGSTGSDIEKMR